MNEFLNKLKEAWGWVVVIVGLLVSTGYFFIDNKIQEQTIQDMSAAQKELAKSNAILVETVANHEGQIESFNNAVMMFMQNPPGEMKYRLEQMEAKIKQHHGTITPPMVVSAMEETVPPPPEGN